jgi:hypothetical protein
MDVYMPRDKNNRAEHRGFGFVTFETEAAVTRIAAHGAHQIKVSVRNPSLLIPAGASPRRVAVPVVFGAKTRCWLIWSL